MRYNLGQSIAHRNICSFAGYGSVAFMAENSRIAVPIQGWGCHHKPWLP
jgi:hypothetical protein